MIIKEVAFGNSSEAFIENRFEDGVNVIFSDDNNKGKTILMQGLMYSIGYDSIFPSTFNCKNYYFYSKLEINQHNYEFLRKKNQFIIKDMGGLLFFDSVTDFKYYFDKNILPLPKIVKDKRLKVVDLSLLYEIFFLGQDNRSPSNLISKGQFNKTDFKNMIFAISGLGSFDIEEKDVSFIKEEIKRLNDELNILNRKLSIKKKNSKVAGQISKSYDRTLFKQTESNLNELNKAISNLKRQRTREINRKSKLNNLLSELNSLNRKLEEGSVKCHDCGSQKIIYNNEQLNFEVSNTEVRSAIIHSIKINISQKEDIIYELTGEINITQDLLKKEIESSPPDFKDIIIYQDEILSEIDLDNKLTSLQNEIELNQSKLNSINNVTKEKKELEKELLSTILDEMKSKYLEVNPDGNLIFEDIFSKTNATFSGSESQEFYFSKLLALNNVMNHEFPILVDSFRDGELSSKKEAIMLEYYKKTNKQVILTATLKKEEYDVNKYTSIKNINVLDYSNNQNSKILQETFTNDFKNIIKIFEGLII
jgi:hypothetical protein